MPSVDTPSLALRVGQHTIGDEEGTASRNASLALLLEPGADNPWELDAVLAVAGEAQDEDEVVPGGLVLAALRDCLWESPSRSDDLPFLLPELLSAVDARVFREDQAGLQRKVRARMTAVFVQGGRYYMVREGEAPAYLLRNGVLRPLRHEHLGRALGPLAGIPDAPSPQKGENGAATAHGLEMESGHVEDGDALVVSTGYLQPALSHREICRAMVQAHSPRAAAVRLAEETHQHGNGSISVGVLIAGSGPALQPRSRPELRGSAPGEPDEVSSGARGARPDGEAPAASTATVAALAGLIGSLFGVVAGIILALSLTRPASPPPAPPSDPPGSSTLRAEVQRLPPDASNPSGPLTAPAVSSGASPETGTGPGAAPAPSPGPSAEPPANGPVLLDSRAQPAPPGNLPPSKETGAPPVHALAPGMTSRVQLLLSVDVSRGRLLVTANQGTLYTQEAPQGTPAGGTLSAPVGAALQSRMADGRGELRFLTGADQVAAAVRGEEFQRLVRGEPVSLPGLNPGEYRLAWWHPDATPQSAPFLVLRVVGI